MVEAAQLNGNSLKNVVVIYKTLGESINEGVIIGYEFQN